MVTANPGQVTERPDSVKVIGGEDGLPISQETGTGKPVYRRGAEAAVADIDIGTASNPLDLTTGSFESGERNAGGAEALAIKLVDDTGGTFDVKVDWLNDDGNVTITEERAAMTNVSDLEANLIMRSDRFNLRVLNNSGATETHGTANAH